MLVAVVSAGVCGAAAVVSVPADVVRVAVPTGAATIGSRGTRPRLALARSSTSYGFRWPDARGVTGTGAAPLVTFSQCQRASSVRPHCGSRSFVGENSEGSRTRTSRRRVCKAEGGSERRKDKEGKKMKRQLKYSERGVKRGYIAGSEDRMTGN